MSNVSKPDQENDFEITKDEKTINTNKLTPR